MLYLASSRESIENALSFVWGADIFGFPLLALSLCLDIWPLLPLLNSLPEQEAQLCHNFWVALPSWQPVVFSCFVPWTIDVNTDPPPLPSTSLPSMYMLSAVAEPIVQSQIICHSKTDPDLVKDDLDLYMEFGRNGSEYHKYICGIT